ncbi:hypothetical protein LXL04_015710 [Taraxacum kok-saghyz]
MSALRRSLQAKAFHNTINDLLQRHEKRVAKMEDEITEKDKQLVVINQVLVSTMASIQNLSDIFNFIGHRNTFQEALIVLQQRPITTESLTTLSTAMQLKFDESSGAKREDNKEESHPERAPETDCEHLVPKSKTIGSNEWIPWSEAIKNASSLEHVKESRTRKRIMQEDEEEEETHITEEDQLRITILNSLMDQGRQSTTQDLSPVFRWNPHAKIETFHLVPVKTYEVSADINVQLYVPMSPLRTTTCDSLRHGLIFPLTSNSRMKGLDWNLSFKDSLNQSRADNTSIIVSDVDFPLMNSVDILIFTRHPKPSWAKNHQMGPPYLALSAFLNDYLCKFGRLDYKLYSFYKDTPAPPTQSTTQRKSRNSPSESSELSNLDLSIT